jgi:MoaA/NifB/PqqE/SkfB family radical SAM enzyme
MTAFFAQGTPEAPGASLTHYKTVLASLPNVRPTWHASVANLGLLSRAVGELSARGHTGLDVIVPAVDLSEDQTEVADEAIFVETFARLLRKGPAGFALRLSLSVGRPYVMPPPSLDVSTHDLCGLACVMCANRAPRADPERMTPAEIGALLREAGEWGIRRIALTGAGEPFRDPHLLSHMEQTQAQGQLVTVTSNGLPITAAVAERVASMHASLSISIHGATDATHEAITGVPGSGAGAWRAISRLVAARDKLGTAGRFSVNVSTVIQRANVHEVAALVERSRQAGCDGHNTQPINLQHGHFHGDTVTRSDDLALAEHLWPTPEQGPALDALFEELVAYRAAHGHLRTPEERLRLFRRYFADPSREALAVGCRVGESFLGIDHRGHIKPCYRLPWKLGDARLRSVRLLWNSRAYARVRAVVDACPLTCMNNCFFRK